MEASLVAATPQQPGSSHQSKNTDLHVLKINILSNIQQFERK
jgi:hypothetical protein